VTEALATAQSAVKTARMTEHDGVTMTAHRDVTRTMEVQMSTVIYGALCAAGV
jgi:hypothetical protein